MKIKLSDLAKEIRECADAFETADNFSNLDLAICYINSLMQKINGIRAIDFDTKEIKIK